jgi:hypothetical protein
MEGDDDEMSSDAWFLMNIRGAGIRNSVGQARKKMYEAGEEAGAG